MDNRIVRSKRERDPSESRTHKRLVTKQILTYLNEKENKQLNDSDKIESDNDHMIKNDYIKLDQTINSSENQLAATDQANEQQISNSRSDANTQSNQTLKQKLVDLNNSKFVIEEGEEEEENEMFDSDDLDGSEYNYDGEDLSENDENYEGNDYPEDRSEDEIDFYRPYEDDFEREMLEKFEKINWNSDESDNNEDDY